MASAKIYHVEGRNLYVLVSNDGRSRRTLAGRPEARRMAKRNMIFIETISEEDWNLNLQAWDATHAAHRLEPVLVATEEQAMEAVKDLFAKGATMLSVRAIQAAPKPAPGPEAIAKALENLKAQHPETQIITAEPEPETAPQEGTVPAST